KVLGNTDIVWHSVNDDQWVTSRIQAVDTANPYLHTCSGITRYRRDIHTRQTPLKSLVQGRHLHLFHFCHLDRSYRGCLSFSTQLKTSTVVHLSFGCNHDIFNHTSLGSNL